MNSSKAFLLDSVAGISSTSGGSTKSILDPRQVSTQDTGVVDTVSEVSRCNLETTPGCLLLPCWVGDGGYVGYEFWMKCPIRTPACGIWVDSKQFTR